MRRCYTGTQVRTAEQPRLEAGDGPQLMRRAAWGLAQHTLELLKSRGSIYGKRIIGLVGKGNNGADTLWALSFLAQRGIAIGAITVHATPEQVHQEALAAFYRAGGRLHSRIPTDTTAVIDGIFGTGFTGSFDVPGYLTQSGLSFDPSVLVVACDIASGILADTGDIPGASLTADLTVTFGGLKVGQLAGAGQHHSGVVRVVDIGITPELETITDPWWIATDDDVASVFSAPGWDAHKYSRGVLSVVAGSEQYPGAAVLVAQAATATGVGYLNLVTQNRPNNLVAQLVLAANPQAVVVPEIPDRASAVVFGPGLGNDPENSHRITQLLAKAGQQRIPVLVDASGLDVLQPEHFRTQLPALVITPHVGEMRRLTARLNPDMTEANPVDQAARFAQQYSCWVVLKSSTTYVFGPAGQHGLNPAQTSELATAGTGDTLAGILGAGLATMDAHAPDLPQRLLTTLLAGIRLHSQAGVLAAADGGVEVSTLKTYIRKAKRQSLE